MSRNGSGSASTGALLAGGLALAAAKWGPSIVARLRGPAAPAGSAPPVAGPLSARRLRALSLVAEVVPSVYGDDRFKLLAPTWDPATMKGTSCGYLPCYVGRGLELERAISQCGLEQLRTNARAWGAWVEPGEGRLPRPGDPYAIDKIDAAGARVVVHVGIVVDASGATWQTADAGQGTHDKQEAKRMARAYDAAAKTIGGPLGPRPLAGWCDLDRVPALKGAKSIA
jgi:hypothetical protein